MYNDNEYAERRKEMKYPEYVDLVIERLESLGKEAFIVGGSVRDTVMSRVPNDYDVTTSALPEEILSCFSDMRTIPTGLKHGTVTVISGGYPIEVTTYRVDGEYHDGRHPDSVSFTDSITEDLSRRDFTVNAMAYSKKRGLVDPFGGREDLEKRVIKAVGDPRKRFSEDALRIMRAFRFSAQLDFSIDPKTLEGAYALASGLENIAAERIAAELLKLICAERPSYALLKMKEQRILSLVLRGYLPEDGEIIALDRICLSERAALGVLLRGCETEKRRTILHALKLPSKLISNTMTVAERLSSPIGGSDREARRFIGECGELAEDILMAADALSLTDGEFIRRVRENLEKRYCTTQKDLAVNGGDLVKLGIKGKAVGLTLEYLLDRVIEDPAKNDKEILLGLAGELAKDSEDKERTERI